MSRECEGFRDIVLDLNTRYGKAAINQTELAEYLGCCRRTAANIIKWHKIPQNHGLMSNILIARALCKGDR